jgi:hypothetical protein
MARTYGLGKNNYISATASGRTYVSSIIHLPGTVTEYRQTAVEASMACRGKKVTTGPCGRGRSPTSGNSPLPATAPAKKAWLSGKVRLKYAVNYD